MVGQPGKPKPPGNTPGKHRRLGPEPVSGSVFRAAVSAVTRGSSASIGHPSSTARLRSITWLDFSDQLAAAHGNDDDQRPPGRNKACSPLVASPS